MLFNLLKWLDASPAHYWTVVWAAFGCVVAGASTLRHDPVFWRGVDGLTHGPLDQWPLLLALFARGRLNFTTARAVSTFTSLDFAG
jgi:hypothetical protein